MEVHDAFFSRIIDMIPKELYRSVEDTSEETEENSRYYKHKKQPLGPNERKAISKAKKEEKYGVSGDEEEGDEEEDNSDDDEDNNNKKKKLKSNNNKIINEMPLIDSLNSNDNASLETLRQRLQQRILGMQKDRTSQKIKRADVEGEETTESNKKQRVKEVKKTFGQKKGSIINNKTDDDNKTDDIASDLLKQSISMKTSEILHESNEDQNDEDFEFSTIKDNKSSKSGQPGTKMVRLKRMLDEATRKRERIDQLKSSGDASDKERATQEQWGDVIKAAGGEKGALDSGKIKKAIKRREKKKEKSATEWKARKDSVDADLKTRIGKREENLMQIRNGGNKGIVKYKLEAAAKAKEEAANGKPRPGFEGKKNGFLNNKDGKDAKKKSGGGRFNNEIAAIQNEKNNSKK